VLVAPVPAAPGTEPSPAITQNRDEILARDIAGRLRSSGIPTDAMNDVRITVADGNAYVRGFVGSEREHEAIVNSIRQTQGLRAV